MKQFNSSIFSKTSTDFQEGLALSFFEYLRGAQHNHEEGWEGLMKKINDTYKGINGFNIKMNSEGVINLYNKKGIKINQLTPLKENAE